MSQINEKKPVDIDLIQGIIQAHFCELAVEANDFNYAGRAWKLIDDLMPFLRSEDANVPCSRGELAKAEPSPAKPEPVIDDNYMTVVFDRSVVNFDKNPMHIKSEFGNVVAVSRGDALAKLDEPVSLNDCVIALQNVRGISTGTNLYGAAKAVLTAAGREWKE